MCPGSVGSRKDAVPRDNAQGRVMLRIAAIFVLAPLGILAVEYGGKSSATQ
jgi:hypothetical protein